MIILDTSFIIALFKENDPAHNRAVGEMKKYEAEGKKFVINEHVLSKSIDILAQEAGLDKAKLFTEFVLENYHIQDSDIEDVHTILEIHKNQKQKLTYSDASLIFLSNYLGCPIATYNENLLKEIESYGVARQ